MKRLALSLLCVWCSVPAVSAEKVVLPEKYLTEQFKWAQAGETARIRADRLEAFWFAHLPRENGGENPSAPNGYEDGTHGCVIVVCGWELTRASIETGQKEKALKILNWLASNDSRTALAPVYDEKPEDDGAAEDRQAARASERPAPVPLRVANPRSPLISLPTSGRG